MLNAAHSDQEDLIGQEKGVRRSMGEKGTGGFDPSSHSCTLHFALALAREMMNQDEVTQLWAPSGEEPGVAGALFSGEMR